MTYPTRHLSVYVRLVGTVNIVKQWTIIAKMTNV
jgi:hypothetical protein